MADADELCAAAAAGDIRTLHNLIQEAGPHAVDDADYGGRTALHLAASEGLLPAVAYLVDEANAFISPVDQWGGTPLDDAIRGAHHDVADYLRKRGAQKGAAKKGAAAVMCEAAAAGAVGRLRDAVFFEEIHPDTADYDGRTAAHLAASEGRVDVLRFLVEEAHANISSADRWGGTPLDEARMNRRTAAIHYLRSRGAADGKRAHFQLNGRTTLGTRAMRLTRNVPTRSARASSSFGPNGLRHLRMRASTASRPAGLAARLSIAGTPRDSSLPGHQHHAATSASASRESVSMPPQGEEGGGVGHHGGRRASFSGRRAHAKRNPTGLAAAGDLVGLQAMLDSGVDLGKFDYDFRTPLHLAACEGLLPVVIFLIEDAGAALSPCDRWGQTPLDNALRLHRHDVAAYLRRRGATTGASATDEAAVLCNQAAHGDIAGLRESTKSMGLAPDLADYDGRTPLHLAASNGLLDVLRFLLEDAKAAHSPIDRWGSTPLDDALRARQSEAAAYLQRRGARKGQQSMRARLFTAAAIGKAYKSAPSGGEDHSVAPGDIKVTMQGWLTKLSKGGFTANWNRRYFVLAGSTLYYSEDPDKLQAKPKLFCEVAGADILAVAHPPRGRDLRLRGNAFAISTNVDSSNLIFSADTLEDQQAWIEAIVTARILPPCPRSRLPTLMAYHLDGRSAVSEIFEWIAPTPAPAAARSLNFGGVDDEEEEDSWFSRGVASGFARCIESFELCLFGGRPAVL